MNRNPAEGTPSLARSLALSLVVMLSWITAFAQMPLSQAAAFLPAAPAATNMAPGIAQSETIGGLANLLAEARAQMAAFGDAAVTNAPAGITPQDVWMRHAALRRLVLLYEQQLSNASTLEKVRRRKDEIAREVQAWTRFPQPLPYSILLPDGLREEIQTERQRISSAETSAATLDQFVDENRRMLSQAEGQIRQLNEQLESTNNSAATIRLSWLRDMERLRSQVAAASVGTVEQERQIGQENLAASQLRLGLLQRQLVLAQAGAKFTQADLDTVTSMLDRQRDQLERELAEAQPRQVAASRAVAVAREELQRMRSGVEDSQGVARAAELVLVRESQSDSADAAIYLLRLMLEGTSVERTMWQLRFAVYDSPSASLIRESEHRLTTYDRRLKLWRDYAQLQLQTISRQVELQEARVNGLAADSSLLPYARDRLEAMRAREALLLRLVRSVEHMARLTERWAEGLQAAEGKLPLISRFLNTFADAGSFVQRLWTFEVITAEDTITVEGQKITGKRSVTIGKIVMALLILVVGYWATGFVTAFVEPVIVNRLKVEPNQARLIRGWLRAFLVVCLLLFSLVSVKIPLTIFAFAGGALAIGLGFGTQTMLKNLVSGLILLFERPFRVGDVLDVAGQKGTVTSIGLRASILQLFDGTETLIPNSSLLENNVTNWTYSNRKVRFTVTVGVAYGSDPRRVIQLLNEVAERHGLVENDPKPLVLFTDFGDSTLTFELRFWVDVIKANSAQVSSDLRLMIASAFMEHGIVIAFPQRDIRLRADQPIPMQMVMPTAGQGADPGLPAETKPATNAP
jgi:potassium-dependent mechanosensitive channel